MKKKNILLIIIITFLLLMLFIILFGMKKYNDYKKIKNAKVKVVLKDDLILSFLDKRRVSDFIVSINGKIEDDYIIDSTKLGQKEVNFKYINDDGIKLNFKYSINVIDDVPPVIWLGDSYSITLGDFEPLESKILCGDNYDSRPNCFIEGEYDYNKIGTYPLIFKAIDSSNNETIKSFTLNVIKKNNSNNYAQKNTSFSSVIDKYKNDNVKIGIDVSKWQEKIDFEKVKNTGASFVMIKVGGSNKGDPNYFQDPNFKENIEGALKVGLDVGVYFYSSASSVNDAKKEAMWVIDQIKKYKITLPVAFDWENFDSFNDYNLSFYQLSSLAASFIKTIEKSGYKAMLYGSKNYLEKIWILNNYDIWLAHYTNNTDYQGKYIFWQLCNNGKIDGIMENVDIDVMFLENK